MATTLLTVLLITRDPLHKTGFKLFRVDETKNPAKRVVRVNTIWQIEQFRNKGIFCFPEFFDFHQSFCSADHSTNGQDDDIPQSILYGTFYTWVFHLGKDCFQVSQLSFFHPTASSF